MRRPTAIVALLLLAGVTQPRAASADFLGQVDTFEDGTTQNWRVNLLGMGTHPAPPVNVPSGGPAGMSDAFARVTAVGGGGPGSRLSVINITQWAGNYLAAGVTAIEMDLKNLGTTDLSLRLELADPTTGPPANIAFSTASVLLPAGGGWTRAVFPIGLSDLTAGLGSVSTALSNATELRLYHSPASLFPNPGSPIPAVVGQLGVDNIRAVPEPSSIILAGVGLLMLVRWRGKVVARGWPGQSATPAAQPQEVTAMARPVR